MALLVLAMGSIYNYPGCCYDIYLYAYSFDTAKM